MTNSLRVGLFGVLLAAGGCGEAKPKLVPVTGTVTLAGKPLAGGSLTFHPTGAVEQKGDRPSCQLRADGTFTAQTYPYGPGVPPGPYVVTLDPGLAGRLKRPDLADPAKTPFRIDVPDGGLSGHLLEAK